VELDEREQHQPHQQHEQHEDAQVRVANEETAALEALQQLCDQEKERAEAARMRAEEEKQRATQLQVQLGHALAEIDVIRQVSSLVLLPSVKPSKHACRQVPRGAVVWVWLPSSPLGSHPMLVLTPLCRETTRCR
jgi:hypothetical protein